MICSCAKDHPTRFMGRLTKILGPETCARLPQEAMDGLINRLRETAIYVSCSTEGQVSTISQKKETKKLVGAPVSPVLFSFSRQRVLIKVGPASSRSCAHKPNDRDWWKPGHSRGGGKKPGTPDIKKPAKRRPCSTVPMRSLNRAESAMAYRVRRTPEILPQQGVSPKTALRRWSGRPAENIIYTARSVY
jgi:hypothetical protein